MASAWGGVHATLPRQPRAGYGLRFLTILDHFLAFVHVSGGIRDAHSASSGRASDLTSAAIPLPRRQVLE